MNKEFEVHLLNDLGISKAKNLVIEFDNLLSNLLLLIPAGRELSIVRTKLEEACFFAKKGVANDVANQKVQ